MTTHLELNKRYQLATYVLEGESFSKVAKRFGISKAGSAKIFHLMKFKIFNMRNEVHRLGIDFNDINNLRESWKAVRMR
jgi:hypothetical protein